jgi:putative tricarboxylic transport membrane protein
MRSWLLAVPLLIATLHISCTPGGGRTAAECIAPANPGGGWDLTCRAAALLLREQGLIPHTLRVTNLPGAGGGIAYANVVARRHGDENVIVAASPATTLRLAQGQYGDFTHQDVRWLAALGADYGVVAVRAGAPWPSLDALLEAWRAAPGRFVVGGGSAVGGQDHMKMLVLARAAGIDPRRVRYVPFDGGGEALTTLLGGFIQVFSGDASEALGQIEARNVRVLAVFAAERVPGVLADIPTAREQGYDVEWVTWRGFYAAPGISDAAYQRWVDALRALEATPAWARVRERSALGPFYRGGAEFTRLVDDQVRTFRTLSAELGLAR